MKGNMLDRENFYEIMNAAADKMMERGQSLFDMKLGELIKLANSEDGYFIWKVWGSRIEWYYQVYCDNGKKYD